MKKGLAFFTMLLLTTTMFSQVFSSPKTLSKNKFSLGLNPSYYNDNFGFFAYGGVGLKSNLDFELAYGFLDGSNYLGLNTEWALEKGTFDVSFMAGGHVLNDFAFDLQMNLGYNIKSDVELYSGLDGDIVFAEDAEMLLWIPVGLEISLSNKLNLVMEGEIPLTDLAFPIFGGGINIYF